MRTAAASPMEARSLFEREFCPGESASGRVSPADTQADREWRSSSASRRRQWTQSGDRGKDFLEQIARYHDLSHLEDYRASMPDEAIARSLSFRTHPAHSRPAKKNGRRTKLTAIRRFKPRPGAGGGAASGPPRLHSQPSLGELSGTPDHLSAPGRQHSKRGSLPGNARRGVGQTSGCFRSDFGHRPVGKAKLRHRSIASANSAWPNGLARCSTSARFPCTSE